MKEKLPSTRAFRGLCSRTTGISLIELVVGMALIMIITASVIPIFIQSAKNTRNLQTQAISSAITLENLIKILSDSRAILHPRAKRGARRALTLTFLDSANNLGAIFAKNEKLWLTLYNPTNRQFTKKLLGKCSAILFHDRGRTRRCLRIRTTLNGFPLATTINLTNSAFANTSYEILTSDQT